MTAWAERPRFHQYAASAKWLRRAFPWRPDQQDPRARHAEGRPATLRLTGGQITDCAEADALIDTIREGDILLADKGYDSNAIRAKAAERKAWANIPQKPTARALSPSRVGSTGSAISWNGYSFRGPSGQSDQTVPLASQRATTKTRSTSSPLSNSSRRGFGARVYESAP